MVRAGSFSLHRISDLRRLPKRITLEEWLAVYGFLALRLESRTQPPTAKPGRPWRMIVSASALAASLFLFQFALPLSVPLSFLQHDWNALPVVQAAVSGGLLATSLVLAFHRPRRWLLIGNPGAEYPHLEWRALKKQTKGEGRAA